MLNSKKNKFDYITEGPIFTSLLKLSFPIMISQLMQTLYNLADTIWVGKVGAGAVASISISFPILFLMIAIAAGLTIAGTAIIAQYKGAGNMEDINKVLGQLVTYIGSLSLLIMIIGILFSKEMITLMGADANIVDDAAGYLRIIFAGMPFMFGFFIFSSILRGIGDTITPAIMMFASVVLNIILDPLLIFGIGPFPELGVQGAAVATVFSRGVVTIYAVYLIIRGIRGLKLTLNKMKPDIEIIKMITKIGLPSSIEQSMIASGQLIMTGLVTGFGTMTLAAYGIVNRIISLPVILAFGVAAASTTMVGQNIGADKKERAEKTAVISITTIFIGLTLIGVIILIRPEFVISVFNSAPEVLEYGSNYLSIVVLTFGFIGAMNVANGVFKGAGRTIPPMIISTASQWIFRVILGYILARILNWQQTGLWWAIAIANIAGALMGIIWLRVTDWSTKVIEDNKSKMIKEALQD